MTELEAKFDQAMLDIYRRAKEEAGYKASLFLQMLDRNRGLQTARTLINSPKESEGYTALYELGRLDLTVEALVVENSRWHPLFTADEIARARKRLKAYRYEPRTA